MYQGIRLSLIRSMTSVLCRNDTTRDATEGCDEAVEAAKKGEKVAENHQSQDTHKTGTSDKQHVS